MIEESLKIFNSLAARARTAGRLCCVGCSNVLRGVFKCAAWSVQMCCVGCSNVLSTYAYYLDVTLGEESGLHYMRALLKPAYHGLLNSLT